MVVCKIKARCRTIENVEEGTYDPFQERVTSNPGHISQMELSQFVHDASLEEVNPTELGQDIEKDVDEEELEHEEVLDISDEEDAEEEEENKYTSDSDTMESDDLLVASLQCELLRGCPRCLCWNFTRRKHFHHENGHKLEFLRGSISDYC